MAGIMGRPTLGAPVPAQPLGEEEGTIVSAPASAGVGLRIPERGDMDATAAFDYDESEELDEVDPPLTARQMRAV